MSANIAALLYLVSAVLFILALRGLSSPETSRQGNTYGMIGMTIALVTTLMLLQAQNTLTWALIVVGLAIGGGIGAIIARRIAMTQMPQLVAAFHSLVGLAAVCVAWSAFLAPEAYGIGSFHAIHGPNLIEMSLGVAIGAITFSGSVIAFAKLNGNMSGAPIMLPGRHVINAALALLIVAGIAWLVMEPSHQTVELFVAITLLSFIIGFLIIIPIGGADMPVVVSMLNSYSGWAAAGIGFTLGNLALIVTGALVGSSGAILSYIMCRAMNRSFISVILGGFGADPAAGGEGVVETRPVKRGSADDAAFIMKNAGSVIIVPGYGMAVAQAQHTGHMNVLLAEANVPYDEVFELEDINNQFSQTDVAFVIGANDVTNPSAKTDPASPIYGMPVLDVEKAKTVLFVKRGMGSGYAGVENELFFRDNTMMLFGDAKKMVEEIVKNL